MPYVFSSASSCASRSLSILFVIDDFPPLSPFLVSSWTSVAIVYVVEADLQGEILTP
jgi:hypothetical protein